MLGKREVLGKRREDGSALMGLGVAPFDQGFEREREQREEREEGGDREGGDEVVFVVEDLDVERERVGLAADVSAYDGYGAEFAHGAGVAEDDAVEEAPFDVGE